MSFRKTGAGDGQVLRPQPEDGQGIRREAARSGPETAQERQELLQEIEED